MRAVEVESAPEDAVAVAVPREDLHVHTQWSWDAPRGDMAATCRAALGAGLRGIAFTEHADFNELDEDPRAVVDMRGYLESVAECRERFPELAIRSGVELGQPNQYPAETAALLREAGGELDRVLGSMHVARVDGVLVDISSAARRSRPEQLDSLLSSSLELTLELVRSDAPFLILAHLEYAKRYWPHGVLRYDTAAHEEEYRAVLEAAAARRLVLEINTTRGGPAHWALGPGLEVLRWWRDAGGGAVSFGSDAHDPSSVGGGFSAAAELASAAGFQPRPAQNGIWGRRVGG